MVILCSPQNPTGGILGDEDLKRIAEILKKHDKIRVCSDEVYSRLVYNGPFRFIASYPDMQHRTIITDGISKTWAMTGWRIGYAASTEAIQSGLGLMAEWVKNNKR